MKPAGSGHTTHLTRTRENLLPRQTYGKLSVEELDIPFPPGMAEDWFLDSQTPVPDLRGDIRDELIQQFGAEVVLVAVADGDGAFVRLALADDEHVGDAVEAGVADFRADLALEVGVLIEETDIGDLRAALLTAREGPIRNVFGNLLDGSLNYLAAFRSWLK